MNSSYPVPVTNRRGLTLIELLIVVSIMVLLAAISVPMLKPMLESQRSRNGARALSMVLQRVRYKAMQEQKTYGIEFVRYVPDESVSGSGDAANLAIQMRLLREGNSITSLPGLTNTVGIRIENGKVELWEINTGYDGTNAPWSVAGSAAWDSWNEHVSPGAYIRLGKQGRAYQLDESNNTKLGKPYNNLNLPQPLTNPLGSVVNVATDYLIVSPRSRPALTAPVALPRGTIVDLAFSGYRNPGEPRAKDFSSFAQNDNVRIMFSPNGSVQRYEMGNNQYDDFHGGQFYFLVGEWDRQTDGGGLCLAEDGRDNLMTVSNYWVTINAETGEVRAAEMNPVLPSDPNMLEKARQFASEVFTNIGGF